MSKEQITDWEFAWDTAFASQNSVFGVFNVNSILRSKKVWNVIYFALVLN